MATTVHPSESGTSTASPVPAPAAAPAKRDRLAAPRTKRADGKYPFWERFPRFIARRPCLVALVSILTAVFLGVIGFAAAEVRISPQGTFYVLNSLDARRYDAYIMRRDDDETGAKANERSQTGFQVIMYYESTEGNVLTEDNLRRIRDVDAIVTSDSDYDQHCQIDSDGSCVPPSSVADYFFDAATGDFVGMDAGLAALRNSSDVDALTERSFVDSDVSASVRTFFTFGLPYDGFRTPESDRSDQLDIFSEWIQPLVAEWNDEATDEFKVWFLGDGVTDREILDTVSRDMLLVSASFIVVFILIALQTWSIFLAAFSMAHILAAVMAAFFIYRIVLQIEVFTFLNGVGIFVVLGIGADDVFIMTDSWKQSGHMHFGGESEEEIVADRMAYTWLRASESMGLTTLTTFLAFILVATSTIPAVRVFGIFCAMMILCNYILVITYYPAVLVKHHLTRCFCIKRKTVADPTDEELAEMGRMPSPSADDGGVTTESHEDDDDASEDEAAEAERVLKYRYVERVFYFKLAPIIHKLRYAIIAIFFCLLVGSIVAASYFKTPDVQPSGLPDGLAITEALRLSDEYSSAGSVGGDPVFLVFGIDDINRDGVDPNEETDVGVTVFSDDFVLESAESQLAVIEMCELARLQTDLVDPDAEAVTCFMEHYRQYRTDRNATFPVANRDEFRSSFSAFANQLVDTTVRSTFSFKQDDVEAISYFAVVCSSTLKFDSTTEEQKAMQSSWQAFMDKINDELATDEMGQGYQVTQLWLWLATADTLANDAVRGLLLGLVAATVVMLIVSQNIIMTVLAVFSIGTVAAITVGTFELAGWDLAFNEAIALALISGLAIDYQLHVALAYMNAQHSSRTRKMQLGLLELGVSIVGSAATTLTSMAPTLFAKFPFFQRFGSSIFIVISFAFLISIVLLPALLDTFGPVGSYGSFKAIWQRIRGRK